MSTSLARREPIVARQTVVAQVLTDHPVTAKLLRPVVAVEKDTPTKSVTLPIGAVVEFPADAKIGLIDVVCDGKICSVFLQDVLDACSVVDVGRITWPWAPGEVLARSALSLGVITQDRGSTSGVIDHRNGYGYDFLPPVAARRFFQSSFIRRDCAFLAATDIWPRLWFAPGVAMVGVITGSPAEVVNIGREYAAAVQEHLHAVMAWLSWIEKQGRS